MRRWGARALGRWSLRGVFFILATVGTVDAQAPLRREPERIDSALASQRPSAAPQRLSAPAPIRYGKWLALGGATAFGFLAASRHHDANAAYHTLQERCDTDPIGCLLSGGRYADPANEQLYQDTRRFDHQAARYLIGAEVLFAASATGFVWELMHRHAEPKNIPFAPRVERSNDRTQVGLSVTF